MERMTREQFFAKLAPLSEDKLQKALWNLYWRGSAAMRQRIEAELEPAAARRRPAARPAPADPAVVLDRVREFVALARSGAYIAGNRRVSPKERTRWRFTFRRLLTEARDTLRADPDQLPDAHAALETMIDLATELRDLEYFRSEDPVEAAQVVVSDEVAQLWANVLEHSGIGSFAEQAAPQLIRWESELGWTRTGWGRISEREMTLATVLASMLPVPDAWHTFADHYLAALDSIAAGQATRPARSWMPAGRDRSDRTSALSQWHRMLIERLDDDSELLDRLATHPALDGPELTFLQARLAYQRGHVDRARDLVDASLAELPGHQGFSDFANRLR